MQFVSHKFGDSFDVGAVIGSVFNFFQKCIFLLVKYRLIFLLKHDLVNLLGNFAEFLRLMHKGLIAKVFIDEYSEIADSFLELPIGELWNFIKAAISRDFPSMLFVFSILVFNITTAW